MSAAFLLILGLLIVWLAYTGRAMKMFSVVTGKL